MIPKKEETIQSDFKDHPPLIQPTKDIIHQEQVAGETKKLIYCFVAIVLVLSSMLITPPDGLSQQGLTMLFIALAAAFLWMTEAVGLGVTGIVIILFQAIFGILPLSQGLAYIAHPVNSVVLVGYLLAGSLVDSGMDKRLSLTIISKMGEKTSQLMLGIMISTAFLSMWMSNTATVAIMVPIATGILKMAGCKPLVFFARTFSTKLQVVFP